MCVRVFPDVNPSIHQSICLSAVNPGQRLSTPSSDTQQCGNKSLCVVWVFVHLQPAYAQQTGLPSIVPDYLFTFLNNLMPRPSAVDSLGQSSEIFDSYSFRKYMNDIGGAYRNQAMELIGICRLFSQAAEQVFTQDAELTK